MTGKWCARRWSKGKGRWDESTVALVVRPVRPLRRLVYDAGVVSRSLRACFVVVAVAFAGCRSVGAEERKDHDAKRVDTAEAGLVPAPLPLADVDAGAAARGDGEQPRAAAGADAEAPKRTLAQHKTVLHVGDSTVGYTLGLSLELGKMFKAAGVAYESHTVTAAGLRTFAKSKVLEKLVAEKNPDLVIVQLGTNNLTVPNPAAYLPDVKAIVAQTGGKPCYWVGPIPLEQPEHGMRALLRENVAPCTFYDSFELKLARQEDKIHPTQPAAKKWADAFWKFANEHPVD